MKYIKGFDGLRCYSILLVVITHLGVANYFKEDSYLREHVFYFFSGSAGVKKSDIKNGKIRERLQSMINQIDSTEEIYQKSKDRNPNPFTPDSYEKGSREYKGNK